MGFPCRNGWFSPIWGMHILVRGHGVPMWECLMLPNKGTCIPMKGHDIPMWEHSMVLNMGMHVP